MKKNCLKNLKVGDRIKILPERVVPARVSLMNSYQKTIISYPAILQYEGEHRKSFQFIIPGFTGINISIDVPEDLDGNFRMVY
jgi:hypothetical protein